jgi:two-component system, OmpR family, alkaline phosphatase synthesis response regulator PhoP
MAEGRKTILIVEDEKNIADAEGMILSDHYSVHVANDGDLGLKMAKKIKPDLILLDLMLPKRGGYDLCFNLRQDKSLKNTKIIMVTAKSQKPDEDKGMFIGADDYITKPFEPDELLHVVNQMLQ